MDPLLPKLDGRKVKVVKLGLNESHRKNNSKLRLTFMILISLNDLSCATLQILGTWETRDNTNKPLGLN